MTVYQGRAAADAGTVIARRYRQATERIVTELVDAVLDGDPAAARTLQRTVRRIVAELDRDGASLLAGDARRAALAGDAAAGDALRAAGQTPAGRPARPDTRAARRLLGRATAGIERQTMATFRRAVGQPPEVAERILRRYVDGGVGVVDARSLLGRLIDRVQGGPTAARELGGYAQMVAVNTARDAANAATVRRWQADAGHDLVRVPVVPGACRVCAQFEGGVYSLTGSSRDYPDVSVVYGGLFHPRCRHWLEPYLPGVVAFDDPAGAPSGPVRVEVLYAARQERVWRLRELVGLTDRVARLAADKRAGWAARRARAERGRRREVA